VTHGHPSVVDLSVVVAVRDVDPWLDECLASLTRQEVQHIEVIVVDDGSRDRSAQIARDWCNRDARFRVIVTDGAGGGSARNVGAAAARGEYLSFCDGDDLVPDGALRALVDTLSASGSDFAVGDFLKFNAAHTWRPTESMSVFDHARPGVSVAELPGLVLSRACWNKVFRREFWERHSITFPDVVRSNDIAPMSRAYLAATRVDVVARDVYLYRERPGSDSMTSRARTVESMQSYLGQELVVAEMMTAAPPAVRSAYSELIFERDLPVHLRRFLAERPDLASGRGAEATSMQQLSAATRALLSVAPAARPGADAISKTVVQDVANGLAQRAAVVATLASGVERRTSLDLCETLLDFLEADAEFAAQVGPALLPFVLAALGNPSLPSGRRTSWADIALRAFAFWGEAALGLLPEAHRLADTSPRERFRLRAEVGGEALRVRGGGRVTVWTAWSASPEAEVVLVPVRGGFTIRGACLERGPVVAGRQMSTWNFDRRRLAVNVPYVLALTEGESEAFSLTTRETRLSGYDPYDYILLDRMGSALVITRRRHWILRGLARGLRAAAARISQS
jgi:hypothetical protein